MHRGNRDKSKPLGEPSPQVRGAVEGSHGWKWAGGRMPRGEGGLGLDEFCLFRNVEGLRVIGSELLRVWDPAF